MIISKNIDISNCNCHEDILDATKFIMKWIETDEFQSWDMKLEVRVSTNWRDYDIGLYRDCDAIHVWIDWNFAYEINLNSGWLSNYVRQLFKNWRWVPGIEMIYHWDRCDPELQWCWIKANYREVEDYLYDDFIDWLKSSNKYDDYIQQRHSWQDNKFNDWLFDHYSRIVDIFLQLKNI